MYLAQGGELVCLDVSLYMHFQARQGSGSGAHLLCDFCGADQAGPDRPEAHWGRGKRGGRRAS